MAIVLAESTGYPWCTCRYTPECLREDPSKGGPGIRPPPHIRQHTRPEMIGFPRFLLNSRGLLTSEQKEEGRIQAHAIVYGCFGRVPYHFRMFAQFVRVLRNAEPEKPGRSFSNIRTMVVVNVLFFDPLFPSLFLSLVFVVVFSHFLSFSLSLFSFYF